MIRIRAPRIYRENYIFRLLFICFLMSLFASLSVFAAQTDVFGPGQPGERGGSIEVPNSICVRSGEVLRLQADVVDSEGVREERRYREFSWRYVWPNGYWEQWNAQYGTSGFGPFWRAEVEEYPDAIDVYLPWNTGMGGHILTQAPGSRMQVIEVANVDSPFSGTCTWGPAEIYAMEPPPEEEEPTPRPEPTP